MTAKSNLPRVQDPLADEKGFIGRAWYRWLVRIEKLIGGVATAGTGLAETAAGELTVATNGVTNAMLAQGPACSVIGVAGDAAADRDDIESSADCQFLQRDRDDALVFRYPMLPAFSVTALPTMTNTQSGTLIYVYDETGGPTIAFYEAATPAFRRVQDRAIVS